MQSRSRLLSAAAMLGICLVIALIALDQTVVGTALPRVVAELQGFELYPWVASAYLLTNAVLIPITGRLGDLYGRKRFVLASIVIFLTASVLCGMSNSMLQLVLARGLQGVGGGMLVGTAFASVRDLFPDMLQRIRWQAMLSATFGISTAIGPVLGGWLTEHFGWRSVFYVNVPVGLLALPVVWRFLPAIVHHADENRSIDWIGGLLLTISICALLITTEQGQSIGFTSPLFWALIASSFGLGAIFVWHQRKSAAPIIPPRLFAYRAVPVLTGMSVLIGFVMFVLIFYAPLLLQGGFDLSPKTSGLVMTPLLVFITVGSIINGRLLPRMARAERLMSYGLAVLAVGIGLLTTVRDGNASYYLMAVFALCGLGLGFQLPNLTLQIQAAVPAKDNGAASALIQTCRTLGSMVGASVAGLLVHVQFVRATESALRELGVRDAHVLALLSNPQVLVREADQTQLWLLAQAMGFDAPALLQHAREGLVTGIHHAFAACIALAVLTILISLRLPPFTHTGKARQ